MPHIWDKIGPITLGMAKKYIFFNQIEQVTINVIFYINKDSIINLPKKSCSSYSMSVRNYSNDNLFSTVRCRTEFGHFDNGPIHYFIMDG